MIKATGVSGDGDRLLMLGLSRENTNRLHADQPIRIMGRDVGLPGLVVVLVAAETNEELSARLVVHGLVDESTVQRGSQ